MTTIEVYDRGIASLKGIEYFKELTYLDCGFNQLTTLDLSQNVELTTLYCYDNQLTTLDVSHNTELKELECTTNQLTTLDVSHNTELKELYCTHNQLTALDVSQNTVLTVLDCSYNQLTTLDVSHNTELKELDCSYNQLTTLDVSQNTKLGALNCMVNNIDEEAMGQLVASLPTVTDGRFYVIDFSAENEGNVINKNQVTAATDKGWSVKALDGNHFADYAGSEPTISSKQAGTISYATTAVTKTYGDEAFTNELTFTGDGTVSYASSNEAVATVDSATGEVTITGCGTTTITATATDGTDYEYENPTVSYELTVREASMPVTSEGYTGTYDGAPHGITVSAPDGATIKYGDAEGVYDLDASPTYTDAGSYAVYFEVTMVNYETLAGSENIVIEKAEGTLSYAETAIEKSMDDTAPFTNELTQTGDGTATFASSDETVAEVDATTGEVTILSAGTMTITATAIGGKNYVYATPTASYELTVKAASGIEGVRGSDSMAHGYYSLDGRKLNAAPTKKGVYILDGRKIVIK